MTIRTWGNPYTHEEHSRECFPNIAFYDVHGTLKNSHLDTVKSCDWCGQKPARLYRYDGDTHYFCNKECYHSYHC